MNTYNSYAEYLASPEWQKLRKAVLLRDGFKCQKCGSAKNVVVHHIHYPEVLGTESQDDLITLCDKCHEEVHDKDIAIKKQWEKQAEERRKAQEEKSRLIDTHRALWAQTIKKRDFVFGGTENMCNLATLKKSIADHEEKYGWKDLSPSVFQGELGLIHRKVVLSLYKMGFTTDDIDAYTPLPRATIERYIADGESKLTLYKTLKKLIPQLLAEKAMEKYLQKFMEE